MSAAKCRDVSPAASAARPAAGLLPGARHEAGVGDPRSAPVTDNSSNKPSILQWNFFDESNHPSCNKRFCSAQSPDATGPCCLLGAGGTPGSGTHRGRGEAGGRDEVLAQLICQCVSPPPTEPPRLQPQAPTHSPVPHPHGS